MTKKSLLALLLASVMVLSGCSLVLKDQSVDNLLPIIEVNGQLVTKEAFNATYEYNLYMEQYYNSMMAAYLGNEATVDTDAILETTIDSYVQAIITSLKAEELQFDVFTEAEELEMQAEAQADYDEQIQMIQEMYFAGSELEGEELTNEVSAYAAANGITLDTLLSSIRSSKISERLKASVTDSVTIDDSDIQELLDSKIDIEKTDYNTSIASYGAAVNSGTATYYRPAGYRTVRVIEIAKPAEEETTDGETAAEGEVAVEEPAANDALSEAEALYARAVAGEAFETLSENVATYVVCKESTDLDEALVNAAMFIPDVNGISPVTELDNSYVIVQYVEELPEHTATLEEVRDELYEETLTNAQDAAYADALVKWESEADVKIYRENLEI